MLNLALLTVALALFMCLVASYMYNFLHNRTARERSSGSNDSIATLTDGKYLWDKNMKMLSAGLGFITILLLIR